MLAIIIALALTCLRTPLVSSERANPKPDVRDKIISHLRQHMAEAFNISSGTVGHCIHFWTTPLLHNHHLDVVAFWGLFSFCFNRPFFYRCFFSSRFTIAQLRSGKKKKMGYQSKSTLSDPLRIILKSPKLLHYNFAAKDIIHFKKH